MDPTAIAGKLRDFIDREILEGQGGDLTADTRLLELGILDSFSLFLVIDYIGKEFGVRLELEALAAEDFASIAVIARTVGSKLAPSGPRP